MTTPPIACSLSPGALAQRTAAAAELRRHALRDRRPIPGGVRLVFDSSAAAAVGALVAAEARCCPFLQMDVAGGADGVRLDITGPEEAGPIIAELAGE